MIKIAITMGDPAGIGPEIIIKALETLRMPETFFIVIGSFEILQKTASRLNSDVKIKQVSEIGDAIEDKEHITVFEPVNMPDLSEVRTGEIQAEAGRAAKMCIDDAVQAAGKGIFDATCTAPIHKEAMQLCGFGFPGHTEYLAHLTGTVDFAMMLCGGGLRVVLQTIHMALKEVPDNITETAIVEKIRLTHRFMPLFGIRKPRIAVCGLNPHAGEGGLFGTEERNIISPAIETARDEGIVAEGPYPADTVFHEAREGAFDAVLAMYHDQGLGPLKTVAFHEGVNITMGLPIIRTSVDHGTAFNIAGKNLARPDSMKAALKTAKLLAVHKRKFDNYKISGS